MPVDKFGRMSDTKTKDTGVSLTYINNNYIRRDGTTPVSGTIDMNGNTLFNFSKPRNRRDAATKKYMDRLIAENVGEGNISGGGSPFFKDNDNFKATYPIDMGFKKLLNLSAPSNPSDAATKKYVDNIKSILNESINSLSQLYATLDKTQEENKEKISKTQEEISKTQEEINEKISKTQEEINEKINETQQEMNEKIDNALCDAPDPVNPQDVATKEYTDKIKSLLNASIIKLSQLFITLSGTVEEYKEKINKTQEEINERIDDATVKFLRENDYLRRISENERKIKHATNLIMVNASYKGRLNSDDYQFSFVGNIINEEKSIGLLMPYSGYITSIVLETPLDFSKQQNFYNNLEYEARTSPLVVYKLGFWDKLFTPFYPHFTPFLPPRTTFKNFLNTLKNTFRYIIQLHHHIIYLTYTSKSFQLNSISYIHTKQSSHNIYI